MRPMATQGRWFFRTPPPGGQKMAPPPLFEGVRMGSQEAGGERNVFRTAWASGLGLAQALGLGKPRPKAKHKLKPKECNPKGIP